MARLQFRQQGGAHHDCVLAWFLGAYRLPNPVGWRCSWVAGVLTPGLNTTAVLQVVALPDDVGLLERLNSAMNHLITDRDVEVARAARKVRTPGCWEDTQMLLSSRHFQGREATIHHIVAYTGNSFLASPVVLEPHPWCKKMIGCHSHTSAAAGQ